MSLQKVWASFYQEQMDWGALNSDMLYLIAKRLGDVANFIRFRSVCKNWRSSVYPTDLPQQIPYCIQCKSKSDSSFDIQFSSLFSTKCHNVAIQDSKLKGKSLLYGSLNGYVLLRFWESSKWLLLNPLTGFQVPLPFGAENLVHPVYFGPRYSCSSVQNEIDVVFSFMENKTTRLSEYQEVCLWRYAEGNWTKINNVLASHNEFLRYSNGILYAFSRDTRDARVIDVTTGDVVSFISGLSLKSLMFITMVNGDLLGVQHRRNSFDVGSQIPEYLIDVFKVENDGVSPHWVKKNGNGDLMLFFDCSYNSFCVKASDFEQHINSKICSLDLTADHDVMGCVFIRRFDTEITIQLLQPHVHYGSAWFVPSLL